MNIAVVITVAWAAAMVLAWAFVHGAQILRRQEMAEAERVYRAWRTRDDEVYDQEKDLEA